MGLFRSKSETYADATIAVDIERGLVARYLARILERGDLPLRGLLGVLYWMNERRGFMNFTIDDELSALVATHYSGGAIFFQMAEVPPHGLVFTNLTPGDFAQGRRQADMLGIVEDADRVIALIAEISRLKPGSSRAAIGFVRQPN